jgi:two-component system, NarL family, response regulator NreC
VTTLLLADDHTVLRQGLRALLEPEFRVVAETGDGLQVADLAERLQPDVVVLDLMMPGLNGLDAARQIHRHSPKIGIVVLSMHPDEAYVVEALKSGASGYVLKGSDSAELVQAIRDCAAGRRYLSRALSERVIEGYLQRFDSSSDDSYETLTPREREVLHLAAEGHSNPDIAKRLALSVRTVESHRANLMRKLGVHSQSDLIHYAMSKGLLEKRKQVWSNLSGGLSVHLRTRTDKPCGNWGPSCIQVQDGSLFIYVRLRILASENNWYGRQANAMEIKMSRGEPIVLICAGL